MSGYPEIYAKQVLEFWDCEISIIYIHFTVKSGLHYGRNGIFVIWIVAPEVGISVMVGVCEGVGVTEMVAVAVAVGVNVSVGVMVGVRVR